MKKLLLVTLISSFIVACGGGGGGSAEAVNPEPTPTETKEQIELRLNLPPEPDMAVDEQTILGIDSNNNKINDHVERLIGFALPNDDNARKIYNRQAELWTLIVENKDNHSELVKFYDEYMLTSSCSSWGFIAEPNELVSFHIEYLRTIERSILSAEISNLVDYDYSKSSKESSKNYCESFK